MALSRLLDPFYVLGTRLDLTGRRARRLMMAAFEALDPQQIATDMATEVVTYDAEEDGSLTRSLVDVLVDHFLDAQIEALDAASEYLSAVAPGPAGVLAPADGFLGQMGNQTVRAFVERTPQGIVARITSGMAPEDALAEAADYIAKVGDAEPHIIGRDSVATVANNDDRFAGYARVARPDACAWCKMLAGLGAVYTKDTAILTRDGQPYHQKRPNGSGGTCRCRMVAVPVDHLGLPPTQYTPPKAGQYAMTTSRYREGSGTPERAGSIDRQLQILRQQLATGKGTDWTRARIARLESERMSSALGRSSTLFLRYDPQQPRDETGKWSASGGGGGRWSAETPGDRVPPPVGDVHGMGRMPILGPHKNIERNGKMAPRLKADVADDLQRRMSDVPTRDLVEATVDFNAANGSAALEATGADLVVDAYLHPDQFSPGTQVAFKRSTGDYAVAEAWVKADSFSSGWEIAPLDSPEGDRMVRSAMTSNLVSSWALSSNDHVPGSHALQRATEDEFGLTDAARWKFDGTSESVDTLVSAQRLNAEHGPVLRSFVRAQYDSTQEQLAGIDRVTVYRGIKEPEGVTAGAGTAVLRPMSSFSVDRGVAEMFASMDDYAGAAIIETTVDTKRILAAPISGVGCWEESEVVLLGGPIDVLAEVSPE